MADAINTPPSGHDGPYGAPLIVGRATVRPDWIDYNGHMNVAYYTKAFDAAMDDISDNHLGLGEAFAQSARMGPYILQIQTHFLAELHEGEAFHFEALLLDHDAKRMHFAATMIADDGREAAFFEGLFTCVDLTTRRSAPYPAWGQRRLAQMYTDHAGLPRPARLSAPIGIRRR